MNPPPRKPWRLSKYTHEEPHLLPATHQFLARKVLPRRPRNRPGQPAQFVFVDLLPQRVGKRGAGSPRDGLPNREGLLRTSLAVLLTGRQRSSLLASVCLLISESGRAVVGRPPLPESLVSVGLASVGSGSDDERVLRGDVMGAVVNAAGKRRRQEAVPLAPAFAPAGTPVDTPAFEPDTIPFPDDLYLEFSMDGALGSDYPPLVSEYPELLASAGDLGSGLGSAFGSGLGSGFPFYENSEYGDNSRW